MEWIRWIYAVPARVRALVFGRQDDRDLEDELSFHVAMQARVNLQHGMSPAEAARRARQALGGIEQTKERSRDVRPIRWAQEFVRDLRYAQRSLRRDAGFTVVAVATLALGIGANTAMFSVLHTYLFRALPYPQPEQLVEVYRTASWNQFLPYSPPNFLDQREKNTVFAHMAAFSPARPSLALEGESAERLEGLAVSSDFFPALGVQAALGRVFTANEDQPGPNRVMVLSDRFWQSRFGGDPNIVGRALRVDGEPVTVVGVMPAGFDHPLLWGTVDLWRPIAFTPEQRQARNNNYLRVVARTKPGVSLPQASEAMVTLAASIATQTASNQNDSLRLAPLRRSMSDDISRTVMWFTFGLSGFVLLIACANLANLQLVRMAARARDQTIRAALGAGRARLLRQSLTESLVLATVGGVLSLLLALGGIEFINRRLFADLPGARVMLDAGVFGFALFCSVLTGLVFGTVPAWLASRADVNQTLKDNPRGSTAGAHPRLRQALIVGEVAFALILLAGAGLFLRGLQRYTRADPGWRVDGLVTSQLGLRFADYASPALRVSFYQRLEERLAALPGVEQVALSNSLPIWSFNGSGGAVYEGQPEPPPGQRPEVFFEQVSLRYFDTLGVRLLTGRQFNAGDVSGKTEVAIINQALARRFWPNDNAIGKRLSRGAPNNPNWLEVVGVVNDVEFPGSLRAPRTLLQVFRPLPQAPVLGVNVLLRHSPATVPSADALRRAVAELDPAQPLHRIRTARSLVDSGLGAISLLGALLGAFAALGLTLAAIGIYGVTSYSVVQRTSEFGIRMALGAQARDVVWLVLANGARLIVLGTSIGVAGAYAVSRLLTATIPTLPTRDPAALAGLTIALVAVALAACYLPAGRATRVDPLVALRHD
jgi:putative ABC transport system permease protein